MNKPNLYKYVIKIKFLKLFSADYFIKTLNNVSFYCHIIVDDASACSKMGIKVYRSSYPKVS